MAESTAPQALKFPAGIDNRSREYALTEGALREATNLDVTQDGGLIARNGLRTVTTGDCHSLFTHPGQRFALMVLDGSLTRLDADETTTALTAVSGPVVYALLNDDVYWTDGSSVGQVTAQGGIGLWGLNAPPSPVVTAVASGGLAAGTYQIAMTAVHPSGLESGASEVVSLTIPDGGGIQVTTPTASGVNFNLYRNTVDSGSVELRYVATLSPAQTTILGGGLLGRLLETLHGERPLPGQCLIHHKGRLWVASGKTLWFTSDKTPHVFFPAFGYYLFESTILMLGATEDGIYVGLYDRVYYLQGTDPAKMTQRPVSGIGVVAGSAQEIPYDLFLGERAFPSRQCAFWDREGFLCIGKPGGIIVRPTNDRYSAGEASNGAMTYRTHEGLKQLVSVLSIDQASPVIASDVGIQAVFAQGVVLNAG